MDGRVDRIPISRQRGSQSIEPSNKGNDLCSIELIFGGPISAQYVSVAVRRVMSQASIAQMESRLVCEVAIPKRWGNHIRLMRYVLLSTNFERARWDLNSWALSAPPTTCWSLPKAS